MVPARRNLLHYDCTTNTQFETSAAAQCSDLKPSRFPRLTMADGDSERRRRRRQGQGDEAAGTSSGRGCGGGDDGKDWLQLGLATASSSSSASSSSGDNNNTAPAAPMELGLFADKQGTRMMRPPLFPLPIRSCQYGQGRYWPTTTASGSMSAPFLRPFARPLRSSGDLMMRVISPSRRTNFAGLWLTLQAVPNQFREPILPQIPKSYLRIKDCNMKLEMVMKYLAGKLGLPQFHQVELTCRGQTLPPFLLVKYVRDSIWCSSAPREEEEALAELPRRRSPAAAATTTDHVMTLFYSTSRNH